MAAPIKKVSKDLLLIEHKKNDETIAGIVNLKNRCNQKNHRTFKMPSSSVLSQVKDFLPQLEAANRELEKKAAADVDIEQISDEQQNYIEMNIAFVEKADHSSGDTSPENSDDEDSDDSDDDNHCMIGPVTDDNFRLHKRNKLKANIEELDSEQLQVKQTKNTEKSGGSNENG